MPGVSKATPPKADETLWTLDLREGADGGALLAAAFQKGVALTHFDLSPPSLHDVFVSLVGGAA